MKKKWLCLPALMLVISCGCSGNRYSETIERQLNQYPESTLKDIYKSYFQDEYGPGHLVEDTASARRYLKYELETMQDNDYPYYEPAGEGDNFYRVNLSIIKQGIISEDDFFRIFLESADKIDFPPVEAWKSKWSEILEAVPDTLQNFAEDKVTIDSLLNSGSYVSHHSKRFEKAYDPHYRLIHKSTFEEKLLPLLENKR